MCRPLRSAKRLSERLAYGRRSAEMPRLSETGFQSGGTIQPPAESPGNEEMSWRAMSEQDDKAKRILEFDPNRTRVELHQANPADPDSSIICPFFQVRCKKGKVGKQINE